MSKKLKLASIVVAALLCSSITCLPSVDAEVPGVRDHINRGNMFLSRRAYEEAIKEYDEALKLEPTNSIAKGNIVVAHTNWGISLANRNQYKEAMEQWQLCLTLSPGYKDAVRNMALLRSKLERSNQLDLIGEGDEGGDVVWQGDKINKSDKGKKENAKASASPDNANAPSSIKILTPGIKQNPESGLQSYDMSTMSSSSPTPSKTTETVMQSQSSPPPSASSSDTMDEQLGQIETKVYGSRQTNMPVIQRLQKLETDAAGHPRTGTIKERIDFLRQTWGL
ncbi:MAG: tetratricopeptide repeat protein [Candidatus Obscuribacterales bacterium]|nr:tetratricopeptide repeat protein [Candidatus Obscuribacterales bacterium]